MIFRRDESKWTELFKKVDGSIRCVKDSNNIEEFASLLSVEDAGKQSMVACSLLNYFAGLKDIPSALHDTVLNLHSHPMILPSYLSNLLRFDILYV